MSRSRLPAKPAPSGNHLDRETNELLIVPRSGLARKAKRIGFGRLREIVGLVTPQTQLGWHRKLIAKKYDSSGKRRKVGRPPTKDELRDLVFRMAAENRSWGYTRIRGAMANLGHEIGRGTIAEILEQAGMEPAPGLGEQHHRAGVWIGRGRGGELPGAAWRFASLLPPGCRMKPTSSISGHYGTARRIEHSRSPAEQLA